MYLDEALLFTCLSLFSLTLINYSIFNNLVKLTSRLLWRATTNKINSSSNSNLCYSNLLCLPSYNRVNNYVFIFYLVFPRQSSSPILTHHIHTNHGLLIFCTGPLGLGLNFFHVAISVAQHLRALTSITIYYQ